MGMLMHQTWLAEQKKKAENEQPVAEKTAKEPETTAKKTATRRKTNNK